MLSEPPAPDHHEPVPVLPACAERERDDVGLGERFRIRYGDLANTVDDAAHIAIKVAEVGFHIFDQRRWKEDLADSPATRRLAQVAARAIYSEMELVMPTERELEALDAATVSRELLESFGEWDPKWEAGRKADYQGAKAQVKAAEKIARQLEDRRAAVFRFAKSACGSSKINAMLQEAAPHISYEVEDLDSDRLAINCESGTLRFVAPPDGKTGWSLRLDRHDPADMITKLAPVEVRLDHEFAPGEDCPAFTAFLERVMPAPAMREFLQRWFGYCCTGLVGEQVYVFHLGAGRNGKSTLIDLICHVLGDYAVTLSIDSFTGDHRRSGDGATPDLARLPGARFVAASEPDDGQPLKEGQVKVMTGGEKFPVRHLNQGFFEVDPHFKVNLSGNSAPLIKGDDDGIWRRTQLIDWSVQIPLDEVDRDLPRKLRAEAAGVFRWMLEGALDYLDGGLQPPDEVAQATKDYREESDPIGQFIREGCVVTGADVDSEPPAELYAAYEKFARLEGVYLFNAAAFTKRFAKASRRQWKSIDGSMAPFRKVKNNTTVYKGIRIAAEYRADTSGGG